MADRRKHEALQSELVAMLEPTFRGITVEIRRGERWKRMCVTFRWPDFAELVPEERFHRLVGVIPDDFCKERLGGFLWLELAPGETIDDYLKLPRSEDVADRERDICAGLIEVHFFELLGRSLGPSPDKKCPGDFSISAGVLGERGYSTAKIREAKLAFIRHGCYCDCQALLSAQPAFAESHAGAA